MEGSHDPQAERQGNVTQLLQRAQAGDKGAENELVPLVYAELRGQARGIFAAQRAGHTLQPTALVHEAFMKLAGHLGGVEGRRHFFVLAGRAMRQIITDHARAQGADKRGGGTQRVTLTTESGSNPSMTVDMVALADSLERLDAVNERAAEVAQLRLFSGLTIEETADVMGISKSAVDREWALGRAWLQTEMA